MKCSKSARAADSATSALVSSPSSESLVVQRCSPLVQLTERQEGDALAVGDARSLEDDGGNVLHEGGDEAALADARLTDDDHVLRAARLDGAVERRSEGRELGRATDQRRGTDRGLRSTRPDTEQAPVGIELERIAAEPRCGRRDEDVARLGVA